MKKRIIFLILLLMEFCLLIPFVSFTFTSANAYEFENNNDYATANDFSLNGSITGKLKNASDKDCYKIVVPQNGKLTITFKHKYDEKSSDWRINCFKYIDGKYECVWVNEKTAQSVYGKHNESISFPAIGARASEIYYVVVTTNPYDSGRVGIEYTLVNQFTPMENYEKEKNDSYSTANSIKLNNGIYGNMSSTRDKDYYKVKTSKAGFLTFSFYHKYIDSTSVEWRFEIYQYIDGSYNKITSDHVYGSSKENYSLRPIEVITNGTYYIKVYCSETSYEKSAKGIEYKLSNHFDDEIDLSQNEDITVKTTPISPITEAQKTISETSEKDYSHTDSKSETDNLDMTSTEAVSSTIIDDTETTLKNIGEKVYRSEHKTKDNSKSIIAKKIILSAVALLLFSGIGIYSVKKHKRGI